jgi:class 3 adenylate cyclase
MWAMTDQTPGRAPSAQIRRASLLDPGSQRALSRMHGALAVMGSLTIGRAILEPGWRWSVDVKPAVGTEWCEAHHLHLLVRGRFAAQLAGQAVERFSPGDVFDLPPGHDAWVEGEEPAELFDVSGNVADFGLPTASARTVATMLMSDIVNSTPLAASLGDARWKQTLAGHDRVVRAAVLRFRGRELDTTGDGFFVAFDSVAAALGCAAAIRDGVRDLGVEVRVGVHTGEIETTSNGVRGIAIHALARIMAAAQPSEVLVSPVVRALSEGSGARFASRGPHALKGISEPMELYALEP